MMKKCLLLFFILITGYSVNAHPWKPNHYVIIDTDGGFDDFRTINLLLASPDVRVLAITASDGVLEAKQVYLKIKSLLCELHHEGILVGLQVDSISKVMNCKPAMDFSWGCPVEDTFAVTLATHIIDYILRNSSDKIKFVCLGSLSTVVTCLNEVDQFEGRLAAIYWATDLQMNNENFNYSINPSSYILLTKDYTIPLHRISGDIGELVYTQQFIGFMDSIENPYAKNMVRSLKLKNIPYAIHWYDESIAQFLHYPEFFTTDTGFVDFSHEFIHQKSSELATSVQKILDGKVSNKNQVLQYFPIDTSYYQNDVRPIVMETIEKYGKEEWINALITNELHRHLGVYATVGVKMGIRAREYFGAGVDEMRILSYAGQEPPFSCMNDGLQVSTGATLGHGLIQIQPGNDHSPKAEFDYLGQKIVIVLKDEYRNKIESEIRELSQIYGLNNNIYWVMVRNLALYYWAEWDRNLIFDIQIIHSGL